MSMAAVREVEQLTAALLEGTLDEALMNRLQSLVVEHADARRAYIRWMHQEADLCQVGAAMTTPVPGETRGPFSAPQVILPPQRRPLGLWSRVIGFSAVSLLVAIVIGTQMWPGSRTPAPSAASLVRDVDAEWMTDGTVIRLHSDFPQEPVDLRSGLGELLFASGVRVVVQAPASLEVVSPKQLRLERGRVVVKAPPGVHDFVVQTPGGQVVDLGTEFGVRVDRGERSSVHVFDGEVRVETSDVKVNLLEDEGLRFTASGKSQDSPSAAKSFLRSLSPPQATPELLIADTFDEPSGDIAGQASGFSASPNHRWANSWRWTSRSGDTKWEVAGRKSPHLLVRGKTRVTSNLIRRFVIEHESKQPLYFSIAIRLHRMDRKRSRAILSFNEAGISMGVVKDVFRMKMGEENDAMFGKTELNHWYRIVGRIEFDVEGLDDRLTMWIDPEDASTPPASVLGERDIGDDLGQDLRFRCHRGAEFDVRDVRIGTTFESVLAQ